jgi:hypothetical protein
MTESVSMKERQRILERVEKLNEAVEKARAYLANGDHGDWHDFQPSFGGSKGRMPHPDWVANVFLPRRLAALDRYNKALQTLDRKAKERQSSRQRKRSK